MYKLSTTQNRVLGAFLIVLSTLLAYYLDGILLGIIAGAMIGAGVVLLATGQLRIRKY